MKEVILMKKKILITLAVILLIGIEVFIVGLTVSLTKKTCDQNETNNGSEKIHLFGKELSSLEDISDEDIKSYLSYPMSIFRQRSYFKFREHDITILIAYKYLDKYFKTYEDIDEIKSFVKTYFGINNFELKEGEYISPIYENEKIIISKEGDRFVSNLTGKDDNKINSYISKETKNNQVIVHYDYGYDDLNVFKWVSMGKTDVYLNYIDGNLILDRIIYTEK
jgi:hypothetical protein